MNFLSRSRMNWWSSDQSNMINGTDGSVFHTFLSRKELLFIFAADLCRLVICFNTYKVLGYFYIVANVCYYM